MRIQLRNVGITGAALAAVALGAATLRTCGGRDPPPVRVWVWRTNATRAYEWSVSEVLGDCSIPEWRQATLIGSPTRGRFFIKWNVERLDSGLIRRFFGPREKGVRAVYAGYEALDLEGWDGVSAKEFRRMQLPFDEVQRLAAEEPE